MQQIEVRLVAIKSDFLSFKPIPSFIFRKHLFKKVWIVNNISPELEAEKGIYN